MKQNRINEKIKKSIINRLIIEEREETMGFIFIVLQLWIVFLIKARVRS